MGEDSLALVRRRAATWAFVRYFVLGFLVVVVLSALGVFAVVSQSQRRADLRDRRADNAATLLFVCVQLEGLKTQNREDVAEAKKNFPRTLRLLHIEDTPEVRRIAQEGWDRDTARNKPRACPYTH